MWSAYLKLKLKEILRKDFNVLHYVNSTDKRGKTTLWKLKIRTLYNIIATGNQR